MRAGKRRKEQMNSLDRLLCPTRDLRWHERVARKLTLTAPPPPPPTHSSRLVASAEVRPARVREQKNRLTYKHTDTKTDTQTHIGASQPPYKRRRQRQNTPDPNRDHGERRQQLGRGAAAPAAPVLQRQRLLSQPDRQRQQLLGDAMRRRPGADRHPGGRRQLGHYCHHHHGSVLHRVHGGAGGKCAGHVHHRQVRGQ